jgi:uncharacterized protein (TIGR04222 family)
MRSPWGEPTPEALRLLPKEIAYAAGGARFVAETTLAQFVKEGSLVLPQQSDFFSRGTQPPTTRLPFESEIYNCALAPNGLDCLTIAKCSENSISKLADRPSQLGLFMSPLRSIVMPIASLLPLVAVLILGVAKILVGLSRDRPVSFLIALFTASLVLVPFLHSKWKTRLTVLGTNTMNQLREKNSALEHTSRRAFERLTGDDLVLAMALFGPAIIEISPLYHFYNVMHPSKRGYDFWSSNSGSSCSTWFGSSCSSGGSSCGGGCGGGCGGCGG